MGEGEGGMIWENSTETCKLPCVKQNYQCQFNARSRAPKASALEQPREILWGGRWKRVQNGGAASAAKLCQSRPTLCNPIDGSPTGSSVPGILQARILAWVAICFSSAWKWKVKVKSISRVWLLQSCLTLRLLATPWTAAFHAPPYMGFSRQEYWSGVPL